MAINGIDSVSKGLPLTPTPHSFLDALEDGKGDFGSLINGAVKSLETTQKSAEQEIAKAVVGESPDLHKTIIALQSADLKFQFGLQVRNKLIGAYEEIMRMQV